jgi:hypothetical protein
MILFDSCLIIRINIRLCVCEFRKSGVEVFYLSVKKQIVR